jgi:hypothetical protein
MTGSVQGSDLKVEGLCVAKTCRVEARSLDAGIEKVESSVRCDLGPVPICAPVASQMSRAALGFEHVFCSYCNAPAGVPGRRILIGVEKCLPARCFGAVPMDRGTTPQPRPAKRMSLAKRWQMESARAVVPPLYFPLRNIAVGSR